jgi:methionyl-tRNA formyltransferase
VILIGDGALLERALKYCIRKDISVELIIAKNNLSVKNIATKKELTFIQSRALNDTLHENLVNLAPTNVFSINNDQIISNDCLSLNHSFFNIHNGLVQNYRGIGEVCVFAAICNQERIYGATLQKLLPYFPPDTGPIVASSHFLVNSETDFYSLFKISLLFQGYC